MTEREVVENEVLIIGAGPVGLGLAIELGLRGIDVLLLEKHKDISPIPKGQNLTQRTLEHFHFWGIEKELRAARTMPADFPIGAITTYKTLLSDYHQPWHQRSKVREYYFCDNERLPQYATEQVLRKKVASLPNVEVQYGVEITEIHQSEDQVIAKDTNAKTYTAQYAVGTDGGHSQTRRSTGIEQSITDHEKRMALITFSSPELHRRLEKHPGTSYYNVLHPDFEGYWLFFGRIDVGETFFFHAPVPAETNQDNFDFEAFLHTSIGAEVDLKIDYIGFWNLRFAVANDYRKDRVFIAGDAAHSHPPYGGYGLNLGMEDARNLGWKLAASIQGWAGNKLLDSYETERKAVFESTAQDFIQSYIEIDRSFLSTYDPNRNKSSFEQAWNAREQESEHDIFKYAPHYQGSPIVLPTGIESPGAKGNHSLSAISGQHLCPLMLNNKNNSGQHNTYDQLDSGYTLFYAPSSIKLATGISQAFAEHSVPLTVIEETDDAFKISYDTDWLLVRPDQFIAATSKDSHQLNPQEICSIILGQHD